MENKKYLSLSLANQEKRVTFALPNRKKRRTTTQNIGTCIPPSGGGGLSGAPLFERSTALLAALRSELNKNPILIGSGGVMCPNDAIVKINEGANLVQIYTGFVYGGPNFPAACVEAIESSCISL